MVRAACKGPAPLTFAFPCCRTLKQALVHVQTHRPGARPNDGFMRQLQAYERVLAERRRHADETAPDVASATIADSVPCIDVVAAESCSASASSSVACSESTGCCDLNGASGDVEYKKPTE